MYNDGIFQEFIADNSPYTDEYFADKNSVSMTKASEKEFDALSENTSLENINDIPGDEDWTWLAEAIGFNSTEPLCIDMPHACTVDPTACLFPDCSGNQIVSCSMPYPDQHLHHLVPLPGINLDMMDTMPFVAACQLAHKDDTFLSAPQSSASSQKLPLFPCQHNHLETSEVNVAGGPIRHHHHHIVPQYHCDCPDPKKEHTSSTCKLVPWTEEEDTLLMNTIREQGCNYKKVASFFPRRTAIACKRRLYYLKRKQQVPEDIHEAVGKGSTSLSGVVGVNFVKTNEETGAGAWVAKCSVCGKSMKKSFSVKVYGFEGAKALAIEAREQMLKSKEEALSASKPLM